MLKLNKMVDKFGLLVFFLLLFGNLQAQQRTELSLSEAYNLLENRYPVLKNSPLLEQIYQKEIQQLDIAEKPSILLKADGRLQSQSTSLDAEGAMLPFEINQPLVNVKTYLEANYLLLDGGINDAQRELKKAKLAADQQGFAVEKYALRERINQLFLNISLLREQVKVFQISLNDLAVRKEQVAAAVEFGTVLESELTKIKVKELELQAQENNLNFRLSGLVATLSDLTGVELSDSLNLTFPTLPNLQEIPELSRPELELFSLQRQSILAQSDLIEADRKPKLNVFAQAGVGYPNPLNILDNNIAPYGIIGAGFSWKITDWQKAKVDKELLTLQTQKLENQEATFEFNLNTKTANYQAEVARLQQQIENDKEIADLQAEILAQLAVQLDEGIITATDYLLQVNAELLARQQLNLHETELLQARVEFWNERGGE